jgi:hypothetical protein
MFRCAATAGCGTGVSGLGKISSALEFALDDAIRARFGIECLAVGCNVARALQIETTTAILQSRKFDTAIG